MKFTKKQPYYFKIGFIFSSVLVSVALILAGVFAYLNNTKTVEAANICDMDGWAWSAYDNNSDGTADVGIGWISFNSNTGGGAIDYSVTVDPAGNMVGYAWSSNIGWIRFGGLSGFPNIPNSGTVPFNARAFNPWPPATPTSIVTFEGWARACAVFGPGPNGVIDCGGDDVLRPNYERGGWDGWISLRGTPDTNLDGVPDFVYNIRYFTQLQEFRGFAYGGPVNVGWVSFNSDTPGSGGGDYAVSIPNANTQCLAGNQADDYTIEVPDENITNNSPIATPQATMTALDSNPGTLEDIRITNVSKITNLPCSNGYCVTENIGWQGNTCPDLNNGDTCNRTITISYFDLDDYFDPDLGNGADFTVDYEAFSEAQGGSPAHSDQFTIGVDGPDADPPVEACTAIPSVAFINQDITWTAQDTENPYTYYKWYEPADPENPVPATDNVVEEGVGLDPRVESFPDPGVYHRYAEICQDNTGAGLPPGPCDPVDGNAVCSASVILNPEFQPF